MKYYRNPTFNPDSDSFASLTSPDAQKEYKFYKKLYRYPDLALLVRNLQTEDYDLVSKQLDKLEDSRIELTKEEADYIESIIQKRSNMFFKLALKLFLITRNTSFAKLVGTMAEDEENMMTNPLSSQTAEDVAVVDTIKASVEEVPVEESVRHVPCATHDYVPMFAAPEVRKVYELLKKEEYQAASIACKKALSEGNEGSDFYYLLFLASNLDYHTMNWDDLENEMTFNKALDEAPDLKKLMYRDEFTFHKLSQPMISRLFSYARRSNLESYLLAYKAIDTLSPRLPSKDEEYLRVLTNYLYSTEDKKVIDFNLISLNMIYVFIKDRRISKLVKEYAQYALDNDTYLKYYEIAMTKAELDRKFNEVYSYYNNETLSSEDFEVFKKKRLDIVIEYIKSASDNNIQFIFRKAMNDLKMISSLEAARVFYDWVYNRFLFLQMDTNLEIGRLSVVQYLFQRAKKTNDAPVYIQQIPVLMVSDEVYEKYATIAEEEANKELSLNSAKKLLDAAVATSDSEKLKAGIAMLRKLSGYRNAEELITKYQNDFNDHRRTREDLKRKLGIR